MSVNGVGVAGPGSSFSLAGRFLPFSWDNLKLSFLCSWMLGHRCYRGLKGNVSEYLLKLLELFHENSSIKDLWTCMSLEDVAQTYSTHQEDSDDETQPPDTLDCDIEAHQENVEQVYDDIEIRDPEGNMRKKRGGTRAKDVWTLPKGSKVVVQCNGWGKPIKKSGGILGGWLGTVARKKEFCSVEYSNWRKMPSEDKDILWKLTKAYFEIPDNPYVKNWVLSSIRVKWKNHKHELKCAHFSPEKTKQQTIEDVPQGMSPLQWKKLVEYWFSEESQEVKNGKQPGRIDFFGITRKKKDGTFVNPDAEKIMDMATNMLTERSSASHNQDADIVQNEVFCEILGEDQFGRVKGYGLGVTPTQVNSQIFPSGERRSNEMEAMQKELADMQANYEAKILNLTADYEGKIAQLKEDHEKRIEELQSVNNDVQKDMRLLHQEFSRFRALNPS
ncbi:hypothetical protein DH2020_001873 [Rehmannia glutinosa]|uniref:Transposase, Ptta/En/Spm, plant n=1 Tax=Rehmannia glutinosa TaxID=99300 RepID=A0ABR0XS84_REHGL